MSRRLPSFAEAISGKRRQFVPRHVAEPSKLRQPKYIKGVYNGNFYRIKIPTQPKPNKLPKIPPPTGPAPHAFKSVPPTVEAPQQSFNEKGSAWWKENWPVLVLNFGSLCTLFGFTRSDQIELRTLSVTGSLSFVIYSLTQKPLRYASSAWSFLFAGVNTYKIMSVLHERNAQVVLDEQEQDIYQEFFMPHGVTPKQFEAVMLKSDSMTFPKGTFLMKQGKQMSSVYLVVSGKTRAFLLNRHLTAASSVPGNKDKKFGGDSGAWIGEMAFLETMWEKEQRNKKPDGATENGDSEAAAEIKRRSKGPRMLQALYSIQAMEDTEVLVWTFDDMEQLFGKSNETRSALTRAMSSAIVSKVVNFTVSRKNRATWTNWLDQISFKGGATYHLVDDKNEADEEHSDDVDSLDAGENQDAANPATAA